MRKITICLAAFSVILFSACVKEINPNSKSQSNDEVASLSQTNTAAKTAADQYVSGEILVKFKKGYSAEEHTKAFDKIGGKSIEKVITRAMKKNGDEEGFYVLSTSLGVSDAVSQMKALPEIEFAEPNFIYTHSATSNDPYFTNGSLWGMYGDDASTPPTNQYGSQAEEAWAAGRTGSSEVYIGIIDEGVMFNHTDIAGNFWTNPYDPVDGADNDGNGYSDDTRGWDFQGVGGPNGDNTVFDGIGDDHGTHVAGTIGAVGGNGVGVAGVCWDVTLISGKFLGASGGTTANAIKAVDYFTDLKTMHGLNIVATSNSWGGGGYSQALYDAIQRANNAGILFIAAAGNSTINNDASPHYPSSYTNANVIAVASITSSGAISSFSNYGATSVDLGAPGSGIYSTVPGPAGKGKNRNVVFRLHYKA